MKCDRCGNNGSVRQTETKEPLCDAHYAAWLFNQADDDAFYLGDGLWYLRVTVTLDVPTQELVPVAPTNVSEDRLLMDIVEGGSETVRSLTRSLREDIELSANVEMGDTVGYVVIDDATEGDSIMGFGSTPA